ncbi:MFS transporter [Biostraticola tofi]|uniref:DHA1 family L-arabinose/isopropyl-beta-D-thiogalactopyranoside export protein-like MFS transporter n=1 Tax=Biostraticola tofi TaxID=466109 RepID=A0A4V6P471_9GAMM|nr:MFS transporter [Biostraticola tofi]TCV96779.1 DHA1 family L-arabinose/isopropyl-beta-D-thiogalactopyranoside export protein-like MFS transporter [Biostraticola tofi]
MKKSLLVLAAGAFISQTTEYLPIGLLKHIATQLSLPASQVGLLITIYAWVITLSVIPMTLLTRSYDRKQLFTFLLGLIALCNGLVMLTDNFALLVLLRIVAALGHGVFWANIASYAISIAKNMSASRATAIVFSGISLSVVLGVPLSTALGNHYGWQNGFGMFGLLSLIIMCFAITWLPHVQAKPMQTEARGRRNIALSVPLCLVIGITLLLITAHFSSYTYVTAFLQNIPAVDADRLTLLMFVFGLGGASGTLLASCFVWKPAMLTLVGGTIIMLGQCLLLAGISGPLTAGGVLFIWGAAISLVIVGLQSWVIETSPGMAELASALYVMAFNVGIGAGAATGGVLIGVGDNSRLYLFSAVACGAALVLAIVAIATVDKWRAPQSSR